MCWLLRLKLAVVPEAVPAVIKCVHAQRIDGQPKAFSAAIIIPFLPIDGQREAYTAGIIVTALVSMCTPCLLIAEKELSQVSATITVTACITSPITGAMIWFMPKLKRRVDNRAKSVLQASCGKIRWGGNRLRRLSCNEWEYSVLELTGRALSWPICQIHPGGDQ